MTEQRDALAAARERRVGLKSALSALETAAASASSAIPWRPGLATALADLGAAFASHVNEVEGPDGLLVELKTVAPRLSNEIEEVEAEHAVIRSLLDGAIKQVTENNDPSMVRAAVVEVAFAIVRHRQRGADLVYEGYKIDIGGG